MNIFLIKTLIIFLKTASLFISKKHYKMKLNSIKSPMAKSKTVLLNGWTFRTVESSNNNYLHTYYEYNPLKKKNSIVLLHGLNFDGKSYLNIKNLSQKYNLIAYNFPEESELYNGSVDGFCNIVIDSVKPHTSEKSSGVKVMNLCGLPQHCRTKISGCLHRGSSLLEPN